mgnify:CR=1 FL=1
MARCGRRHLAARAGQALGGLLAGRNGLRDYEVIATQAYELAQAMIRVRDGEVVAMGRQCPVCYVRPLVTQSDGASGQQCVRCGAPIDSPK